MCLKRYLHGCVAFSLMALQLACNYPERSVEGKLARISSAPVVSERVGRPLTLARSLAYCFPSDSDCEKNRIWFLYIIEGYLREFYLGQVTCRPLFL